MVSKCLNFTSIFSFSSSNKSMSSKVLYKVTMCTLFTKYLTAGPLPFTDESIGREDTTVTTKSLKSIKSVKSQKSQKSKAASTATTRFTVSTLMENKSKRCKTLHVTSSKFDNIKIKCNSSIYQTLCDVNILCIK